MTKKQCSGNVDDCFKCGAYYSSHSAHYENVNGKQKEVITITCCFGTAGTFAANSRERLKAL